MNRVIILVLLSLAVQVKATTNNQTSYLKSQFSNQKRSVLPQQQAAHFCRLLYYSDDGNVYPLSVYAQHLTALLCGSLSYGEYSAEQVFTGLIFFYDEWELERMPFSNGQGRILMEELHSGQTLRVFPHSTDGTLTWYTPTDSIPTAIGDEHRKYIHEVFTRLNGEVQAGNWENVDAFIDRMIEYQCRFGDNADKAALPKPQTIVLWLIPVLVLFLVSYYMTYNRKDKTQKPS